MTGTVTGTGTGGDYNSSFALRAVELKMDGRQWDSNPQEKKLSFSKSSLAAHKAISGIYSIVSKIYLYRFMRLNIDQITVYQSVYKHSKCQKRQQKWNDLYNSHLW